MSIHEHLNRIQQALHAPKDTTNEFGGYQYRSAEQILAAVKPLLEGCTITVTEAMIDRCDRVYVESTAMLHDGDAYVTATAYAREALVKKKSDDAQITGAASSYAKKYALGNLFAIDNTPDADTKQGPSMLEQINSSMTREQLIQLWGQMTAGEQKEHESEFKTRTDEIASEQ